MSYIHRFGSRSWDRNNGKKKVKGTGKIWQEGNGNPREMLDETFQVKCCLLCNVTLTVTPQIKTYGN